MRLDIPSGTAVRFEPGEAQDVSLTGYGGERIVIGQNDVTNAPTADHGRGHGRPARTRLPRHGLGP